MLKNILKLDGAQELTAAEQKSISGGITEWMAGNCKSLSSLGLGLYCNDEGTYWYQMSGWCCISQPPTN